MSFDRYFDVRSRKFSSHYGNERVTRALGRGALFDRLRFAVETVAWARAEHVLDVGCGSGPLFGPLASHGVKVTGLEPAPGMRELALAEAARYPGLVEVEDRGWETLDEQDAYDVAVALGVFDYVDVPGDLLGRMGRAAPHVVGSFPSTGLRTNLRKYRYGRKGVGVHGYTTTRINQLAAEAGLRVEELSVLGGAGWAVHFTRPDTDGA